MNIYHLPGTGLFGGIKVGYQFAQILTELGAACVVATPDGSASQWFEASVATLSHTDARSMTDATTNILFSYPPDFDELCEWGGRLVNHCQGTDDRMERIVRDERVSILTCWPQAAAYVQEVAGRSTVDVGIPISNCFFYDGSPKFVGRVCYMPRRGVDIAKAAIEANPHLSFVPIDGMTEWQASEFLKSSEYFIATAVGEQFGLPAFEAMAAGAIVVSVPVRGGMDYLRDGENCLVVEPDALPQALQKLSGPECAAKRAGLRYGGVRTSLSFRQSLQRAKLKTLLESELAYLRA